MPVACHLFAQSAGTYPKLFRSSPIFFSNSMNNFGVSIFEFSPVHVYGLIRVSRQHQGVND